MVFSQNDNSSGFTGNRQQVTLYFITIPFQVLLYEVLSVTVLSFLKYCFFFNCFKTLFYFTDYKGLPDIQDTVITINKTPNKDLKELSFWYNHNCFSCKWPFLTKKKHHKIENWNTWYFDKIKTFLKPYDLLYYFCNKKNCFLIWVWPMLTPFLCKSEPKIAFFKNRFSNFFPNYWIARQVIDVNWIP